VDNERTTPDPLQQLAKLTKRIEDAVSYFENYRIVLDSPPWLTLREASTSRKLSTTQLRRLIKSGKIPAFNANPDGRKGKILLSRYDLDKFIVFGHCRRLTPEQKRYLQERLSND